MRIGTTEDVSSSISYSSVATQAANGWPSCSYPFSPQGDTFASCVDDGGAVIMTPQYYGNVSSPVCPSGFESAYDGPSNSWGCRSVPGFGSVPMWGWALIGLVGVLAVVSGGGKGYR